MESEGGIATGAWGQCRSCDWRRGGGCAWARCREERNGAERSEKPASQAPCELSKGLPFHGATHGLESLRTTAE